MGLAVCDAVGTTLEFRPPGSYDLLDDMIGGGPFRLIPGQVSRSSLWSAKSSSPNLPYIVQHFH